MNYSSVSDIDPSDLSPLNASLWLVEANKTLDLVYLCTIMPISLVGFVLNLISFVAIKKIRFQKMFFKSILKTYALVSLSCCLVMASDSLAYMPSLLSFEPKLAELLFIYRCKYIDWIAITLNFYIHVLDIVLLFERMSNFVKKLKNYSCVHSNRVCFIYFCLCVSVNLPSLFFFTVQNFGTSLNQTNSTLG